MLLASHAKASSSSPYVDCTATLGTIQVDQAAYGVSNGSYTYNINWHVDWSCSTGDNPLCTICCGSVWWGLPGGGTGNGTWTMQTPGMGNIQLRTIGSCGSSYTTNGTTTFSGLVTTEDYKIEIWAAPAQIVNGIPQCSTNASDYSASSVVYFFGSGPVSP